MRRASSSAAAPDLCAQATHLVVFQHGLWGNEKDFRNFQTLFAQYFAQDEVYAHIATSNATSLSSLFQTYDGIDTGGTRLADEVEQLAREMPRLSKFSIVGHSLGGLYARYCVGVLFARGFFEDVEPMNFVTLATPHMGIRRSQPTPMNAMFNVLMPNFFDLTGQQFTLRDTASEQAVALSHSVRRYPHRRPNVAHIEIEDMLFVRLPHVESHPATATLAEKKAFEVLECMLREGVLRMYRKTAVPADASKNDAAASEEGTACSSPGTDDEDGEEDAASIDGEDVDFHTDGSKQFQVTCLAEIDLVDAQVTILVPEKGGGKHRRRRHSLRRRASELSINQDGSFWDIEIEVLEVRGTPHADEEAKPIMGKAVYTIRIPYDELTTKWKWIPALSNASHGVHCRSLTTPTTAKDAVVNSTKPMMLSCLTRGQFIQALQLFRNRTLYASIFNDMQVPYSCGAIRAFNPYRTELDPSEAKRSPCYPHVVMRSIFNAPLLRDTLPEDVKDRVERESSADRFSLVKMLSERTTSRRRYSTATREQSFNSFFTNLTSSNSGHPRPNRARSELPPRAPSSSTLSAMSSSSSITSMTPEIRQRLDAIPPAPPNSLPVNTAHVDTDSEHSSSSDISATEGKRVPPFEEGPLLLDHADHAFSNDELRDSLRGMMISLQSVGWRRIDVHFHSPIAHMKIIAMTANPSKPLTKGLDVVHHVMDTFLL